MRLIESERMRECTFRPCVSKSQDFESALNLQSSCPSRMDEESAEQFHRRQMAWLQQKQSKVARGQREAAEAAARECTFQPHTRVDDAGGSDPAPGPGPADGLAASRRLYEHAVRAREERERRRARLEAEFQRLWFRPNGEASGRTRPASASPPRRRFLAVDAGPRFRTPGLIPTAERRLNQELQARRGQCIAT